MLIDVAPQWKPLIKLNPKLHLYLLPLNQTAPPRYYPQIIYCIPPSSSPRVHITSQGTPQTHFNPPVSAPLQPQQKNNITSYCTNGNHRQSQSSRCKTITILRMQILREMHCRLSSQRTHLLLRQSKGPKTTPCTVSTLACSYPVPPHAQPHSVPCKVHFQLIRETKCSTYAAQIKDSGRTQSLRSSQTLSRSRASQALRLLFPRPS